MAKIQFNSKSFANFRTVMAKYHNANHETKDFLGSLQETINGDKASLSRNESALAKLINGDTSVHESRESLEAVIEQFKKQLENHEIDKKNATLKKKKAEEDAVDLITDNLYNAYKAYIECKGEGDADAYALAIAEWFMEVQKEGNSPKVEVTANHCMGYIGLVGSMNDSKSQITGMLRKAKPRKTFTEEWLKTLADNLQNANIIAPHNYAYIPVRMRKKDEK